MTLGKVLQSPRLGFETGSLLAVQAIARQFYGGEVRFALFGLGYWGRNYVRLLQARTKNELVAICDASPAALEAAAEVASAVHVTSRPEDVLASPEVDAVIIATPATTHFELALAALKHGKHVLCEKPLAMRSADCEELMAEADQAGLVLFVGHTFIYNPAVRAARGLVLNGDLGEVRHCQAVWTAPGPVRHDVNSMWDLAPHPLSILTSFFGDPLYVSATGQSILNGRRREDVALVHIGFGSVSADVHVSWVAPTKTRTLTITGDRRVAVFDDMARGHKLQIFDTEAALALTSPNGSWASARTTAALAEPACVPELPYFEPLRAQLEHFLDCCHMGTPPDSSGLSGLRVVRILEAAQESLEREGERISLDEDSALLKDLSPSLD